MNRFSPSGRSGALQRIEGLKEKVAGLRERFDQSGRITKRMDAFTQVKANIMHTIASVPVLCQEKSMFSGRKYLTEETQISPKKGAAVSEATHERYHCTMPKRLKNDLQDFAASFDVDMSDVVKSGAQIYTTGFLPVIGTIPAGDVKEAIRNTQYYEVVPPYLKPRPDLGDYLLEVNGDSMSPKIDTGSLVMLRPDIEAANGEICAVQVFRKGAEDRPESTLKRVFKDYKKQVWTLKPINPDYPEQEFSWEEYELNVVGVYRGQMAKG